MYLLPKGRAAPPVKGRGMNNIGMGPPPKELSIGEGTPETREGGILLAARPHHDAATIAAELVANPANSLRIPEPVQSRSALRNRRRSLARALARKRLKQEYHTARRLRRQYETDLSLARTLQATFDLEATPPLVNQMGNGLLPLVSDSAQPPPRESRQRRRRKARKSRLQGRNIKRHLAQLALSLRCQSSAHIASPCACSPASDESLPLHWIAGGFPESA